MVNQMTEAEFFNKAEWEGGILEFIINYGCDGSNLPEGRVRELVQQVYGIKPLLNEFTSLSEQFPLEDDSYYE